MLFEEKYSHWQLVEIAAKWLQNSYPCVFMELVTSNFEIPDVIGFKSGESCVIECKTSRSDFLADKKKRFRINPQLGMGSYRYYCAPKGLIKLDELPEMWGLIEVENGKARLKHNPYGKNNVHHPLKAHQKNMEAEFKFMYSILRRLQLRGVLDTVYAQELEPYFRLRLPDNTEHRTALHYEETADIMFRNCKQGDNYWKFMRSRLEIPKSLNIQPFEFETANPNP